MLPTFDQRHLQPCARPLVYPHFADPPAAAPSGSNGAR
jgi:hypothetical protein